MRGSVRVKCHSRFLHFLYLLPVQIARFANVGRIQKKVRADAGMQKQRKGLLVIRGAAIVESYPGPSIRSDTIYRFGNGAYRMYPVTAILDLRQLVPKLPRANGIFLV